MQTKQSAESAPSRPTERLPHVVRRLFGVNIAVTSLAFASGPLLAHALGPTGRGQLAAIVAVATLAPYVADFGLGGYLSRQRARGEPAGVLLGSTLPIVLCLSLIGAALAVPIAAGMSDGASVVHDYIVVVLLTLPISASAQLLVGLVAGEERWRLYSTIRLLAALVPVLAYGLLTAFGTLTVASATIATLAGGMFAFTPTLGVVRRSLPLRFDRLRCRAALRFGAAGWLGSLAYLGSLKLDQVVMVPLVPARELGLYAVATSISLVPVIVPSAVVSAIGPRVSATGDGALSAQSARMTGAAVGVVCLLIAGISPFAVPFLFGRDFANVVPILNVLLVAATFGAVGAVTGQALIAGGRPGATVRPQVAGLVTTCILLLLLLPSMQAMGAAITSLIAYGVTMTLQVRAAARHFDIPAIDFLLPRRCDVVLVASMVRKTYPQRRNE